MKHLIAGLVVASLALAACGGPPATAQATPPPTSDPLTRPYIYEVPADRQTPSPPEQQTPPTVQVTGRATVSVPADMARVSFAVETHAKEAAAASSANAEHMSRVIDALKQAGFAGFQVETYGYSLNPEYATPTQQGRRTRVIDGYTAVNNIRVTVSDAQAVGRVVDTAIGAGANRVSSLSFGAKDTERARKEALSLAVADARAQAQAIAEAMGRELGPPLEVHGSAQAPAGPRPMTFESMARTAAPTPVEAGEQSVAASVTVRFVLGPEKGER